jgi:hypothetical protein
MTPVSFRIWTCPQDRDVSADIEIWHQGLEPVSSDKRSVAEWAREHLRELDLVELFDLDNSKHWQIVGKGTLEGWHDHNDEYDETFDVLSFEKLEVPAEWFEEETSLSIEEKEEP